MGFLLESWCQVLVAHAWARNTYFSVAVCANKARTPEVSSSGVFHGSKACDSSTDSPTSLTQAAWFAWSWVSLD